MRKLRWISILVVCTFMIFSLCACSTPAGRTAGQVVDDGTITTKVKTKLFNDAVVSGFAISVSTFKGEVTLTGSVDSKTARDKAEYLARHTTGVRKVNNLITIK